MDFNSTVKGSALEGFYPAGWDFEKIDACIDAPEKITERQNFWNKDFNPIMCSSLGEFEQGRPMIEKFRAEHPEYRIVLTFFSPSGYNPAKNYQQADIVCYLPFDTKKNVRRFLDIL